MMMILVRTFCHHHIDPHQYHHLDILLGPFMCMSACYIYKYACVLGLIAGIRIIKVGVTEISDPVLSFTIYNPDKKNIEEFSKNELQFYANFLYLIDNIRYVFTLMITITQIDLALFSVLIGEITSLFTIRMLLNEKTFDSTDLYSELII